MRGRARRAALRPAAAALALAVALAPAPAAAATTPATTAAATAGSPVSPSPAEPPAPPRLDEERATAIFLRHPKVADWLDRYPPDPTTDAEFRDEDRRWTVKVWSGEAGQVALGKVDDGSGEVVEAWTGPQVAWKMARGYDGAFGGRTINSPWVWLGFSAVFLLGLGSLRRPLSLRNLDLLALLAFTPSLYAFNRGEVFWSAPLAVPPLLYVIARLGWIGARGRAARGGPPVWPVWALLAATVFLLGFRIGLNVQAPHSVIDVGYAGVIGAHRIANGQMPYGHFPVQDDRPACGPADAEGEIRNRIQTNGRCESSNERGDTYGPVSYLAYVPGFALFGWSGKWGGDTLPAAHFTSIAWDLLVVAGLLLVGRRYGGARLAVTLAFAWAAYPFTAYTLNSNTNDAIPAAFLVWGFWLAASPWARGAAAALSGWTKFGTLIVAPLWLTYPSPPRARPIAFAGAFAAATVAAFAVLLLEPDVVEAARTFADRTFLWQLDRRSPFSLWGWGQYHAAGVPDLKLVQRVLQAGVVAAALAVAFVPRRKSPLQLAALTGALVAGFELVLEHWSYLYIPWFFPFAAFALLAGSSRTLAAPPAEPAGPPSAWSERARGWPAVAVVAAAVAALAGAWALLHSGPWDGYEIRDTPVYERYGDAIARGEVPYRDFRPEYPPLALPAFALPSLLVGEEAPQAEYARAFDRVMLACAVAALVLTAMALLGLGATLGRLAAALAFVAVSPLLLGTVVLSRYDLWPVALVAGAVAAFVAGRERLAAGVLGAAAAAKIYPLVLVPLLGAWVWRRRGRRAALAAGAAFAAVVAACVVPFLLLAPDGLGASVWRQLDRPLQIESLLGSALIVLRGVAGLDVEMVGSHGSQNVAGRLGDVGGVLSTLAAAAVLVWLWARFARGAMDGERFVRYAAAAVVAFVALGKVVSPQFLVWLVPLVPLVAGRRGLRASALLGAALVLTQLWFPSRYWTYARELDAGVATVVLARDLVLVGLLVVLVWPRAARGTVPVMDERDPTEAVEGFQQGDGEPSDDEREFLDAEHVPEVPGEPATSPGEHRSA